MKANEMSLNKFEAKENESIDIKCPTPEGRIPIRKLYVSNLPTKVIKEDLKKIFSIYGEVQFSYPKRKTGYVFITFTDENNAVKVRKAAKNKEIVYRGKVLKVSPAHMEKQPDIDLYRQKMSIMKLPNKKRQKKNREVVALSLPTINILDNDCLIKIFLYLPIAQRIRIERVCKRWQTVSSQSWNDIKELKIPGLIYTSTCVIPKTRPIERGVGKLLLRCGRFLNKLEIKMRNLTSNFDLIPNIAKHCHNLQSLILDLDHYPRRDMLLLFLNMRKLERLELFTLNRTFLGECLKNLPMDSMKELCLRTEESEFDSARCFTYMTHDGAVSIQAMKNLWKLELHGYSLKGGKFRPIVQNQSITHLSFENCRLKKNANLITNLRGLKYLNLSKVTAITDTFLMKLATNCTELEHLNLSNCTAVTNNGINNLVVLKKLTTLIIDENSGVNDSVLSKFITLKVLHCKNCHLVSDYGLIELIQNAPHLEELNLYGTTISHALLDAAYDIAISRTNSIPLKIIIRYTLELGWDRSSHISPCPLIVEGRQETFWGSCWDDPFMTDDYDGYDDFDNDFDDDYEDDFDEDESCWEFDELGDGW